jgi:hypothetical protein
MGLVGTPKSLRISRLWQTDWQFHPRPCAVLTRVVGSVGDGLVHPKQDHTQQDHDDHDAADEGGTAPCTSNGGGREGGCFFSRLPLDCGMISLGTAVELPLHAGARQADAISSAF